MKTIDYHLRELDIALDPNDARNVLPPLLDSDRVIVDIGCGIGQSFIALNCTDRICIGIDVDEDAIRYGIENYGNRINYLLTDATRIPLPANSVDLVFSRVSLPYTNIPRVFDEIRRVLRPGGRVWMTLHSRKMALRYLREGKGLVEKVHGLYVLANGYLLKWTGRVLPFITGRYESWQDPQSIKKLLQHHGFLAVVTTSGSGKHIVIEGQC